MTCEESVPVPAKHLLSSLPRRACASPLSARAPPTMVGVTYDTGAFNFFLITVLTFYLVPATYFIINRIWSFRSATSPSAVKPRSRTEADKLSKLAAAEASSRGALWSRPFIFFVVFTVLAALLAVYISFSAASSGIGLAQYNPYEVGCASSVGAAPVRGRARPSASRCAICHATALRALPRFSNSTAHTPPPPLPPQILGIDMAATDKEIKVAYKKLSLKHHPDKPGGSAEMFQKLAKAYEALTDEEAKKNYREFGNPDGRQALNIAIGLPSWIMNAYGKWLFLGTYVGLLCVAIPWLMFWCYRNNKPKGPGGLHTNTFEWLKFVINPDSNVRSLPDALAGAVEFGQQQPINPQRDSEEMKRLSGVMIPAGIMPKLAAPERTMIPGPLFLRNLVALYAHLGRKTIESPTLAAVQTSMLKHSDAMLALMLEICVARTMAPPQQKVPSHLDAAFAVIDFMQMVGVGCVRARL